MNKDDIREKDFEYYLKHFKVKRTECKFHSYKRWS